MFHFGSNPCIPNLLRHPTVLRLIQKMLPAGFQMQTTATGMESILTTPTRVPAGVQGAGVRELDFSPQESAHLMSTLRDLLSDLDLAAVLAPSLVVDEAYRQRRRNLVRQLANHGRVLARYQTHEMILYIQRRAAENTLNRGLSLSLPYFDDGVLEIRTYDFEVIPRGRIQFVAAFVVIAAQREQDQVQQDPRFSPATRNHLLAELKDLERAFEAPGGSSRRGLKEMKKQPVSQAGAIPTGLGIDQAV